MNPHLRNFDMRALQETLDAARRARGLTWIELAAEINVPFEGTPSIPISVSTISSMQNKRSVTSAVVLQVLRWLGRTPESFLAENTGPPREGEILPDPGRGRILRLDTRAIHAALDAERRKRGMTWKQVAGELPGFSESMLTNLATGPLIGFPRVMMLFQWLGRPAASFVRVHNG
jgi:transcriptional regulator with XRE-family HTH domain